MSFRRLLLILMASATCKCNMGTSPNSAVIEKDNYAYSGTITYLDVKIDRVDSTACHLVYLHWAFTSGAPYPQSSDTSYPSTNCAHDVIGMLHGYHQDFFISKIDTMKEIKYSEYSLYGHVEIPWLHPT